MKTSLKATLEAAIEKWAITACEHPDRPEGYWTPDLATQMVDAAAVVFDTSFTSSQFTEKEVRP